MIEQILITASGFSWIEWLSLVTGVIYIVLASQNKYEAWIFGIISSACIAYQDFLGGLRLYADGTLQLFYIVMGVIGLYQWSKGGPKAEGLPVKNLSLAQHIIVLLVGTSSAGLLSFILSTQSDAALPLLDTWTTLFSVFATFLLVQRYIDNWYYWIFIDFLYVYIYGVREAYLFALLFFIYALFSLFGAWFWQKQKKEQNVSYVD